MVRRVIGFFVGSVALATSLSGCLLPIDSSGSYVRYVNVSSQDVVVTIEGLGTEFPMPVASKSSYPESLGECRGTSFRVETVAGEFIGRVKEQACPDWTLTINEDGTLDYVKD